VGWPGGEAVPWVGPLRGLAVRSGGVPKAGFLPTAWGSPAHGTSGAGKREAPSFRRGSRRVEAHCGASDACLIRENDREINLPSPPALRETSPGGPSLSWRCGRTVPIHSPVLIRVCCDS